ncbi:hypothetical protein SRHO_G00103890 [Serrasalmus rhombeus]
MTASRSIQESLICSLFINQVGLVSLQDCEGFQAWTLVNLPFQPKTFQLSLPSYQLFLPPLLWTCTLPVRLIQDLFLQGKCDGHIKGC